ncbi:MAG: hypothetical protein NUV32_07845 [Exilispira sp.]|jgi:hypothetical protein|nr:hypothetical protein [Exilispira sp.]
MNFKSAFYNCLNQKYEKRFAKILTLKLLENNIEQAYQIIEEINQKAPLIFESYIKNNKTSDKIAIMHIRLACFFLSVYSSLRICYKEKENLLKLLEDISSQIFYNEIKFLLKISFLFSKNKLIAIWNYFILLQTSIIKLFFSDYIILEKDYQDQKIHIIIKPDIYVTFFEKHKSESLTLSFLSYFDALIKVIEKNYTQLLIEKKKDLNNFTISYLIYYGNK